MLRKTGLPETDQCTTEQGQAALQPRQFAATIADRVGD
jgi:hypothetical protein